MKKFVFILTTVIIFSGVTFAQSDNVLNLTKGQKFRIENKIITTHSFEMQCQSYEYKTEEIYKYLSEVRNSDSNSYYLINTIKDISLDRSELGHQMNVNPEKNIKSKSKAHDTFRKWVDEPKKIKMEKTGDVTTMNSAFSSALPQQENAEANGYGARIAFLPLPINLKVGSAWVEFSENGSSSKYTTFIVREVNENIATIDFNGTTSIEGLIELQGVKLRQKTFGRYYGEQKVDVNSGVVQFNSSTTDASGLIAARGQDLPVTIKIISTTNVRAL